MITLVPELQPKPNDPAAESAHQAPERSGLCRSVPEYGEQERGCHRRGQKAGNRLDVDEELGVGEGVDDGDPGHGQQNQDHDEAPADNDLESML